MSGSLVVAARRYFEAVAGYESAVAARVAEPERARFMRPLDAVRAECERARAVFEDAVREMAGNCSE